MDHVVCAMGEAALGLIAHCALLQLCEARPSVAFALWRETSIDASIFREAITNAATCATGSHILLCQMYCRAQAGGISSPGSCGLLLSQFQIGEALGISVVTANRGLQAVRRTGAMELRDQILHIRNWKKRADIGEFDPAICTSSGRTASDQLRPKWTKRLARSRTFVRPRLLHAAKVLRAP
jgi:hypothetical protein